MKNQRSEILGGRFFRTHDVHKKGVTNDEPCGPCVVFCGMPDAALGPLQSAGRVHAGGFESFFENVEHTYRACSLGAPRSCVIFAIQWRLRSRGFEKILPPRASRCERKDEPAYLSSSSSRVGSCCAIHHSISPLRTVEFHLKVPESVEALPLSLPSCPAVPALTESCLLRTKSITA